MKRLLALALAAAALAGPVAAQDSVDARLKALDARITRLEDANQMERVQRTYGYFVDKAQWTQLSKLFAKDATYRETPYDEPFAGRTAIEAYWAKVTSGQQDIAFTYEVIACTGDEGVAHWHCTFTAAPGGETIDLDGIFRCGFADSGRVRRFEEWWHIRVTPANG